MMTDPKDQANFDHLAPHQPYPHPDPDPQVLACAAEKRARLRSWIKANGLSGVIISRRDNFAWLTAGGDSRVLNNTEFGVGHLVLTLDSQYLVAYTMDGRRLLEEEARDQGYQLVELHWHEMDPRSKALELAGRQAAADTNLVGALEANAAIGHLHFPLHELEISRLRWLAGQTGAILEQISAWVQPGLSEVQIAQEMDILFTQAGIDLDVLIVGSDERIFKYRHPLPTLKPLDKYLLLHPAARRWGLHANVSRSIHFGAPPEEVKKAYHAAVTIEGRILTMLSPGLKFADILEYQKAWYSELGFVGEWENHFQGGPTAYQVADPARCLTGTTVEQNQAFDWFITITGAKVEELALLTAGGIELPSAGPNWPCLQANASHAIIRLPDLFIR
jgi:Xaa-Pro aminopeptidase